MEVRREVEQHFVNRTGTVLPVPLSHKESCVGIHWLRISFPKKALADVSQFCSSVWGDFDRDGFGLWSYSDRFHWSSGVSLNFDADDERSFRVHCDRITLDCPGSACDEITVPDLLTMMEYFEALGGDGKRVDGYYDDYNRRIYPHDLDELIKNNDYSGLRHAAPRHKWCGGNMIREEVAFGERGSYGNGKYIRFYNKELESDGEKKCNRFEVEFTGKKADSVFHRLASTGGDVAAFSTILGSLIAGSITFVHRTGEKNVGRLERYEWWKEIVDFLGGELKVRVERKKDSLTGKIEWVKQNVSPSLACLKKVFVNDKAFFRWLFDICKDGDGRMNPFTDQIARENEGSLDYHWGKFDKIEDAIYDKAMSQL